MEEKILFKCKHCDNDDLKHMIIKTIVRPNPDFKSYLYTSDMQPFINLGLHIDCAKCNKDTLIIVEDFYKNQTQLPDNVPQEVVVHVKFQKPLYSSTKFILTDDMTLDKVVVDINNQIVSLITQQVVTVGYKEITEEQYKGLKNKMVEEVKAVNQKPENNNNTEFKPNINHNGGKK